MKELYGKSFRIQFLILCLSIDVLTYLCVFCLDCAGLRLEGGYSERSREERGVVLSAVC